MESVAVYRTKSELVFAVPDGNGGWTVVDRAGHRRDMDDAQFRERFEPARAEDLVALSPVNGGTPAARARGRGNAPRSPAGPGKRSGRLKWDVERAKAMWNADTPAPEIAGAVGCTAGAVTQYAGKHGWKKRSPGWHKKTTEPRPRKGAGRVIPTSDRPLLERAVTCPSCGHQTIVDPCAHCHTHLPTALGGTRTPSHDPES